MICVYAWRAANTARSLPELFQILQASAANQLFWTALTVFWPFFQALIARPGYGGSMQDCGGNRYAALPPQASLGFGVE